MGCIYSRKGSRNKWIKWKDTAGAWQYESVGSPKHEDAKRLLKLREGDTEHGVAVSPKMGRITFTEASEAIIRDYENNGKRSLPDLKTRIKKHLTPAFGGWRLSSITTTEITKYQENRRRQGATNSTINREVTILKRMFTLAMRADKVQRMPHMPMLKEPPPRQGFFERAQFEQVRAKLRADMQGVATFAYLTGWRTPSEILTLQWRQVDFKAGQVRLDPGTTKNDEGRVFPLTVELRTLLQEQRSIADRLQRQTGQIALHVFSYERGKRRGKRITYNWFNKAWRLARERAGCPGRIPHDFRRTAVRNLVRAGVPERVAMQMTGHKTRSVFERYNIVSEGDLREAALKLESYSSSDSGARSKAGERHVSQNS